MNNLKKLNIIRFKKEEINQIMEKKNLLSDVDFSRVVEVHVAGGSIVRRGKRKYYVDDHSLPVQPEVWAVFDKIVQSAPNLKAVCYECEGAIAASVLPVLDHVRTRVLKNTCNEALRTKIVSKVQGIPAAISAQPPAKPLPLEARTGYHGILQLLFDEQKRKKTVPALQ